MQNITCCSVKQESFSPLASPPEGHTWLTFRFCLLRTKGQCIQSVSFDSSSTLCVLFPLFHEKSLLCFQNLGVYMLCLFLPRPNSNKYLPNVSPISLERGLTRQTYPLAWISPYQSLSLLFEISFFWSSFPKREACL